MAERLRLDFPGDETMRISHEAIYQALYVQGRGALKRELTACLRTGRASRVARARTRGRGKSFVTSEIPISERLAEVEDRAVSGHWEGDLIFRLNRSAIRTLVERSTRFTVPLHLPLMEGHVTGIRQENGPALAGHGAEAVRNAITHDHHIARHYGARSPGIKGPKCRSMRAHGSARACKSISATPQSWATRHE